MTVVKWSWNWHFDVASSFNFISARLQEPLELDYCAPVPDPHRGATGTCLGPQHQGALVGHLGNGKRRGYRRQKNPKEGRKMGAKKGEIMGHIGGKGLLKSS